MIRIFHSYMMKMKNELPFYDVSKKSFFFFPFSDVLKRWTSLIDSYFIITFVLSDLLLLEMVQMELV